MTHSIRIAWLLAVLSPSLLAPALAAQFKSFTDQASFLAQTGASSATGPLPNLGLVSSATVGSATFSVAPGGDNLAIGALGTLAEPDWYAPLPGNDIALGFENLQVGLATRVHAIGFDFAQPDASMPWFGGTPVDSSFEITLYDGATQVAQASFASIPTDVVSFLGLWSAQPFDTLTIIESTPSPFADDDEYFGEFYTGTLPYAPLVLTPCTDKVAFLASTGALSASGPLPNLGVVDSAKLGSARLRVGPGGGNLAIGPFQTGAEPDWCDWLPGNDIALGYENLEIELDAPVTAFGIDFAQPDATMPTWGGTPVDSTYEIALYDGPSHVGQLVYSGLPTDVPAFLGICSNAPFDRVTVTDITPSPFVDDDEFFGEVYCAPGPFAWTNLGYALGGVNGDPLLSGTGALTAGSSGALELTHAAISTPAVLVISAAPAPTPLLCGTVVPWPPLVIATLPTNSLGELSIPWTSWSPALSGASLYFQFGLFDPSAVCSVALSNALRADVP